MIFPRFFFLSDDELLEIIVQSKHVQAVQPHLKKCFENIRELRFEVDLRIIGMYSAEYEEVTLRPPICPKGNVEDWLGQVESAMRNTLREFISEALEVVEQTPRKEWVCMWPGQVVLCGGQAYWTAHVEEGIRNDTLSDYYNLMLLHVRSIKILLFYKRSKYKYLCRKKERKRRKICIYIEAASCKISLKIAENIQRARFPSSEVENFFRLPSSSGIFLLLFFFISKSSRRLKIF
ncbi:dynein heavy chain 12, axonemal-like [Ooceraea biroi]|uniref:dynein heavy chain 12, axonemal-like n=1 Tax=Ooceraea biroi TaxID=2015173 RepID=UPI000F077B5E|nr:dynein heavy chain 12, axonemal-like [Ooceraea biroi]